MNNISLCFVINGNIHADYRATTGVRDVVCLAALQRVGWYEESDKRSIKRPNFNHVCQAAQGCCLFVGEVTRLLQCGHSNTKHCVLECLEKISYLSWFRNLSKPKWSQLDDHLVIESI